MPFRGSPFVPRRVGEPLAEDDSETDVVSAAAPLELARRRLVRQRTATALRRRAGAARLGNRLRQRSRRQRVDVRLFSTPCRSKGEGLTSGSVSIDPAALFSDVQGVGFPSRNGNLFALHPKIVWGRL